MTLIDLTGARFGRLTVLARSANVGGAARWLCACSCGRQTIVRSDHLRCGETVSCSCWRRDAIRFRNRRRT
jgi:hypothetical protein